MVAELPLRPASDGTPVPSLLDSLALLALVWAVLALAPRLGPGEPAALATLGAFSVVTAIVVVAAPGVFAVRRPRREALRFALGALAGWSSTPAWIGALALLGGALGLSDAPRAAGAGGVAAWVSMALLAPAFEEGLYRGALLPALAGRLGVGAAVVLSSAAFALPHLEPWTTLTAFAVGLALGPVRLVSGSLWLCIGLHAGLNAAALRHGVPPPHTALEAITGAAVAALGLWLAFRVPPPRITP